MKKIALLLSLLLIMLPLAACNSAQPTPQPAATNSEAPVVDGETQATEGLESILLKKGKLVVGTSPDYPPFESLDETGKLVGFDIELGTKVAQEMGLEIEFVQMSFDTIISALQAGQVDVGLSGFTYDPERDVIFSTPYLNSAQMCVVQTDSEYQSHTDLAGKNVYAGPGTTGEKAAQENIENVTVALAGDYQIAFEMLRNGQIDAVVCDRAVATNYDKQDDFRMLEAPIIEEENSMIIKKGNDMLGEALNAAIEKYMASDEYTALVESYKDQGL